MVTRTPGRSGSSWAAAGEAIPARARPVRTKADRTRIGRLQEENLLFLNVPRAARFRKRLSATGFVNCLFGNLSYWKAPAALPGIERPVFDFGHRPSWAFFGAVLWAIGSPSSAPRAMWAAKC